jgi:hypothetical protein
MEEDERFNHHVIPGSIPVWSGLAISCYTSVYELRIDFRQGFIVHSIFLQSTRKVVFNQYIAALGQFVENVDTSRMLK